MLIINTISRPVFFIRDGRTVETNNTGERITQEEFATLRSEKEVICVDENSNQRYTYEPNAVPFQIEGFNPPAIDETPVITEIQLEEPEPETPATDAGRVPELIPTGSETPQA